ncbi:hypothetical protein INT45_000420 [Circinella minor]|uniref:Uncharacterized protein n=1 Tax=Circinella minor TaxID=1195481 RepID=A0A8H7VDP6_9FUNG|nr:hypothetical protein INT45_000420 [Circinella minor]
MKLPALEASEIDAAVEHLKKTCPRIVLQFKNEHNINDNIQWSDRKELKPLQLQLLKAVENAIGSTVPLKACIGHWGVRLLVSKHWANVEQGIKRKGKKGTQEPHAEEGGNIGIIGNLLRSSVENRFDGEPDLGYLASLMDNMDSDVSVEHLTQRVMNDRSNSVCIDQAADEGHRFENEDNTGMDSPDFNATFNNENDQQHNDDNSIDNEDISSNNDDSSSSSDNDSSSDDSSSEDNDDNTSDNENNDDVFSDSEDSDENLSNSDNDDSSPDTDDGNRLFNHVHSVSSSSRDDSCHGKQLKRKRGGSNENEGVIIQNKKVCHDIGRRRMELRPRHKNQLKKA